jgi:hypothetical protein
VTPYVRGEPVIYLDGKPTRWLAEWKDTMILDSLARPLYDTANSGPPRAWECLVCPHELTDKARVAHGRLSQRIGRTVLPTLAGIRLHFQKKHPKLVIQGNLFDGYQSDLAPAAPKSKITP